MRVERGQLGTQSTVYILVHLQVSVRREVVHLFETRQVDVDPGVPGDRPLDPERRGPAGSWASCGAAASTGSGSGIASFMVPTLPRTPGVRSTAMATITECRGALDRLSDSFARADGDVRSAAALDRSLSCHITDLDTTFTGRLTDGRILVEDTVAGPPPAKAQIRLAMTGDDLVAMVGGDLNFAKAWASGRVKLEAGFRDLLRLRSLL